MNGMRKLLVRNPQNDLLTVYVYVCMLSGDDKRVLVFCSCR